MCTQCPTVDDCPLATFPSSCLCAQCPPPLGGQVAVPSYPSAGPCPTACSTNMMMWKVASSLPLLNAYSDGMRAGQL